MRKRLESFTIGALADAAGVNVETIRFYHRTGLISQPHRPVGSIRRYGEAELARVRFRNAKHPGEHAVRFVLIQHLDLDTRCLGRLA